MATGDSGFQEHSNQSEGFFFLVARVIVAARQILTFRELRTGHEIWRNELESQLRPSLLRLLIDERRLKKARNEADYDVLIAREGKCRVGTSPYLRSVPPMEKRQARAEARWHEARLALQAAQNALIRAQNLLLERKGRDLAAQFKVAHRAYERMFQEHVVALTRAAQASPAIGAWSGASHCEVLAKIMRDLMTVLQRDQGDGDYLARVYLEDRLRKLSHDDWERLNNEARREASTVTYPTPPAPTGTAMTVPTDVREVFNILDALYMDVGHSRDTPGTEVFDELFGSAAVHEKLKAFAARLPEFKQRFPGTPFQIADFAVTSGHEAVAFFAGRVECYARVRAPSVGRLRDELAAAVESGDAVRVAKKEYDLHQAGADLIKALERAFEGWINNSNLIWRHLENECTPAPGTSTPRRLTADSSPTSPVTLVKTPRDTTYGARFFRASKVIWQVGLGQTARPMNTTRGMEYVHKLLSSPGLPIHAWTLANGTPPPTETVDEVVDWPTLEQMRQSLRVLREERAETNDQARLDDLDEEITKLQGYLSASTTGMGSERRPRRARTDCEKVREKVGKAITVAIRNVARVDEALGTHLEKWIVNPAGMEPCYACPKDDRPVWQLQPEAGESAREG